MLECKIELLPVQHSLILKGTKMTQAIIFTNDNGGVSVCIPTGEISIEAVQAKDTPAGSLIVSVADLPNQYNDFFDAWEMDSKGKVTVSLDKAKELTKKRLRAEREPLLQAQDVAFQRALESGSDTSTIVAEKTRLRDITSLADAETTLEGLRAIKV
jgi:peptidyl-tRNA hydrolase